MTRPTRIGRYSGALGAALGGNPGEAPGSPPSPSCCDVGAQPPDRGLTADAFSLSEPDEPGLVQWVDKDIEAFALDIVLDDPPTPGNLLVLVTWSRNHAATIPSEFDVEGVTGANPYVNMATRVVEVGDDETFSYPGQAGTQRHALLMEWAGVAEPDDVVTDVLESGTFTTDPGGVSANPTGSGLVIGAFGVYTDSGSYLIHVDDPPATTVVEDWVNTSGDGPYASIGYLSSGGPITATAANSSFVDVGYVAAHFPTAASAAAWNITAPNVTDGDDDTYHVPNGTDLIRMDLGAAYRILSTRIRIATETSGARTLTIKGANVADFSDEVTLGTIAFTATGSYTAQDVTGSWYTATSYRYFELSIDSDEGNRVHAWELYEGTLATNHQHSLINLSDVSGTPQNLDVLAYGSNTGTWQPRSAVLQVTSNGSNALTNPLVNFASGSNITFAVASNTLTIHGAAAGGGGGYTDPLTNRGDLVVRNASATTRLAIGTSGYVLTSDGTDAAWAAASGSSPITTRGDLVVGDSSGDPDRLAIGTSGYVLTSDGTDAAWAASASGFSDPMTTRGDIIVRKSGGTDRLALGTSGYVLTSDGTDIAWAAAASGGIAGSVFAITAGWDGGDTALTTATMADIDVIAPADGDIVAAYVMADPSGSAVVDVWVDDAGSHPPTDADSITSSAPPTISGATLSVDSTLTGWTTTFSAGDVFRFHPDSVATAKRVTVTLLYERT